MSSLTALRNESFVQELRRQMVNFAALRLQDSALAEDAVHEALVSALKDSALFSGRSALKTWVFGILKNKIADSLRQQYRQVRVTRAVQTVEPDEELSAFFDDTGHWRPDKCPANWGNPEAALEEKQFLQIFQNCLSNLPPQQARVFFLREFLDLETEDICNSLGISVSNLHVTLHRARMRIRANLEKQRHWGIDR